MARRRIGQEQLVLDGGSGRSASSLDQMATLIDWPQIDRQLDEIYRSPRGGAGWPPLSLFKGMLLAMWHDLSGGGAGRPCKLSAVLWLYGE